MRIVEPKKKPFGWKLLRTKFRKNEKDLDVKEESENVYAGTEATSTSSVSDDSPRNKTSSRSLRTKAINSGRFKRSGGGTESLLQKSERESERRADEPNAEQRNPDTDFVTEFMSPFELMAGPPSDDRVSSISDPILPDHATVSKIITVMSTLSTPRVDCEAIPTLSSAISPSPQVVADFDPWEDDKSNSYENPWKSFFSEDPFPHNQLSTLARPDPSQAVSKQSTSAGSDPSQAPPTVTTSESSSLACSHRSPQVLPTRTTYKPSVLARSDSSPQDPPSGTRSKSSTLARSDPQVLFAGKTRTPHVFKSKHSTTVTIHAPSVLEDSLTTHSEGTSQVESSLKTQSISNRTNVAVTKAEQSEPDTPRNASLPVYSPDLWRKGEEENESEPWDVASSEASVVIKAPMKAEERSMPKESSAAVASPTRLQTKAIMRKKTKAFMRKQPTVVPNRQHSLFHDSTELTFSKKINSIKVPAMEDTMMQDDASMLTASETKSDISVAEDILSEVDEVNAVMQDYSTGLILSESKSFAASSVAEEILADDSTETEVMQDDLELMLLESKKVGAISVAEDILADDFLNFSDSKSFGATSVAEETEAMQNDWAEPKITDSKSFVHDWTETEAMQNDWAGLKISDLESFGHASVAEVILAEDLTSTEMIRDDSTESLVPPMSPLSRSFSSQSDCEMSLQKKAIAAAAAHKSRGGKAKVKDDLPFDERGLNPNDREEVTQEAIDGLNHNDTITQISSSDGSKHDTGDLKLVTEMEVACEPTTGETMVATKLSKTAVLWTRIMPSSSQFIDGDVGTERGPSARRHRTASPEVSGSGLEEEEERPSSSLERPCAAKQDEATPTSQSVPRSPDRRQQKLQQIRRARRMLRSGLWQKPVLADRIVVQEVEGEVEVVLENDVMPRKYYAHRDSKHNATASCTDDGSTSLYSESAWMDDFDGDSRCYSLNEARSHVAGPGSFVAGPEYYGYGSDSEDDSMGTDEPDEIWDEITELFKLQWRDAWQAI